MPDLAITRLQLADFRNYVSLDLAVDAKLVVLVGANGAGKTNLLEALSLLSPGRGLRSAALREIGRATSNAAADATPDAATGAAWSVVAHLATADRPLKIGTGLTPETGQKRAILIDGAPAASQTALADQIAIVWMTPDMDRLFHDSAGTRRRFVDRLVYGFDPRHAGRVNAYTKAIRERARLLKSGRHFDPAWAAAHEATAAEIGVAIAAARREVVAKINAALDADPDDALPRAHIDLQGAVETWLADRPALAAEDRFRAALEADRAGDAAAGRTATGPHRSDLIVTHLGHGHPAARCSTGEQKAILATLVLAYARSLAASLATPPIVLLDEAVAHLDEARREALFTRLIAQPGQIWLTGTDAASFSRVSALLQMSKSADLVAYFRVQDGHITPSAGPGGALL